MTKKTYEAPVLTKREKIERVAANSSSFVPVG